MILNQLITKLRQSSNPQELLYSLLENQSQGNPFYSNLLSLAKDNNYAEIEKIARNMAQEKGVDFDKEFSNFKQLFGIV